MKKRTLGFVAGALLLAGGAAAIAAVGERGGWRGSGLGWQGGEHHGGRAMRGRDITKEDADARARERFARIDRNSDGFLDASEIEATMADHKGRDHGKGARAGMGERLIHRFDANRDGKVSRDEMAAYLERRFALADLDNDGRITDADLPPMMRGRNALAGDGGGTMGRDMGRRGGGIGGNAGFSWLRGADADKDGVITKNEALAEGLKRFTHMDRNKDGTIDQSDFDALRKETVDYRVKRFLHGHGADKDGKVSREQYFKAAAERFALADLDNDGRITPDDMGKRHGGRGHGRGHHGGPGHGPQWGPGMKSPGGFDRN